MQEIYYEETATLQDSEKVTRKYNFFRLVSKICYILFTLYAVILFMFFAPDKDGAIFSIVFTFLPLIVLLAMAIVFGIYKNTH